MEKNSLLRKLICVPLLFLTSQVHDIGNNVNINPNFYQSYSGIDYAKQYIAYAQKYESPRKVKVGSLDFLAKDLEEPELKVLSVMDKLMRKPLPDDIGNCWKIANYVYKKAKVNFSCVYSDLVGQKYVVDGKKITIGKKAFQVPRKPKMVCSLNKERNNKISPEEKLQNIKPGYLIAFAITNYQGHNAIFLDWKDENKKVAYLYDGRKVVNKKKNLWVFEINLEKYPVFLYWKPVNISE